MNALRFSDLLVDSPAALLIVKATIVLALACAAGRIANNISAARRHLLWLVALASCVWLALSSPIVPAIVIHAPIVSRSAGAPTDTALGAKHHNSATAALVTPRASAPSVNTHAHRRAWPGSLPSPRHPLLVLWILGCVVLISRHAIGVAGAARLARRASIESDDTAIAELAEATETVGVRRSVRVTYSADVRTPITFGVAKPCVLLPVEARFWSVERRRAVLVHEAAHIARGDWLAQSIGRLACDLFWFHPLAWLAFSQLRCDAERAADDLVLRSGMTAAEYAKHLLEIARGVSQRPGLATVGILSANNLERRFVAIFDTTRPRGMVTSRTRAITAGASLAVLCPFASVRIAAPARVKAPLPLVMARGSDASIRPSPTSMSSTASRVVHLQHTAAQLAAVPLSGIEIAGPVRAEAARPANIGAHPNFSGKWRQDTTAGAVVESHVNDSLVIRQSETAISFEERGHTANETTYSPLATIPFGGAGVREFAITGADTAVFISSALWVADTLVIDTHSGQSGSAHTIERLSLSPDGNTLIAENLSTVGAAGARWRFGGPLTFVMRRIR